ncbi:paired amphipathic helix protein SIN3 4-like [Trifolium pratense]|uniref:Paired amphipathic helix protein SIN3 4-like n=1 Tax=Trifolium pratense TaxID=57577 RepID=A0A2K3MS95_TRIPR|nr:paired amphipathic helix protein SIN3 4-like [Trifolium pratense]
MNILQTRFEGDGHAYKSFLNIMNMLGEGKKPYTDTYHEVVALFEGHADLLDELIQFFPGTSKVEAQGISNVQKRGQCNDMTGCIVITISTITTSTTGYRYAYATLMDYPTTPSKNHNYQS